MRQVKSVRDHRGNDESVPVAIRATVAMRRLMSVLVEDGIYGTTVEEVAERLVCRQLEEMFERTS